jgi:Predicted amidophosphoribosyltransferases
MKTVFSDLLSLFFPNICTLCKKTLVKGEEHLCVSCLNKLSRTYVSRYGNPTTNLFKNNIDAVFSSAFLYYEKGGNTQKLIYSLKYHGNKKLGYTLGRQAAIELQSNPDFVLPDLLIPVPLHLKRQRKRGYNQSEWIAKGINSILGGVIDTSHLKRKKHTDTQTKRGVFERNMNMENSFFLEKGEELSGKHILLIDDVFTSGATVGACARLLLEQEGVKVSLFALSIAK